MTCPRCGTIVAEGQNFCSECGAPVQNAAGYENNNGTAGQETAYTDAYGEPPRKKNVALIAVLAILGGIVIAIIAAVVLFSAVRSRYRAVRDAYDPLEGMDFDYEEPEEIDLDKLNEAVESMKNLDLDTDIDVDFEDPDIPEVPDDIEKAAGDEVNYSYTDVVSNGDDITVTPNGGLNGSTVLANGKDLGGFLDYVDSTVLEKGRTINRDLLYDLLAIMLVDKDLSSDFEDIEKNMIMAFAMANNFHDTDVTVKDYYLNANNAAEYRYHVKAFGKDDTWVVNYNERSVYFNDGKTEYSSDMFKDEYLAMWMIAIEEYYGR